MAFTKKVVGSLVFNQQEGVISHKRTGEQLAKYPIKLAIPIPLLADVISVAIDSTGEKHTSGHVEIPEELVKYASKGILEAHADDPSATDAEVKVELWNWTDTASVTSITFSGAGGHKKAEIDKATLQALAGKVVNGRISVTTASATSGATQNFRSIVLVIIIDLT